MKPPQQGPKLKQLKPKQNLPGGPKAGLGPKGPKAGLGPKGPKGKGMGMGKGGLGAKFLRSPVEPGSMMTQGMLNRQAKAATNQQYAPQVQEINTAQDASNQRQGAATGWFDQYKQDVARSQANMAGQYASAQGTLANNMAQSSAADTANRNQISTQAQQDAANRGMTVSPQNNQQSVDAQNSRQMLMNSFSGALAGQGAARQGYMSDISNAGSAAQLGQRLKEGRVGATLGQTRIDLAGKKRDYNTKYRADVHKTEGNLGIARQTLNLNTTKAASDVQQKTADRQQKGQQDATTNKIKLRGQDQQNQLGQQRIGLQQQQIGLGRDKLQATIQANTQKAAATTDKAQQKALQKSNEGLQQIYDIVGKSTFNAKQQVPILDPKTNKRTGKTRPANANDLQLAVGKYSPDMIHLAHMLDSGKQWGQREVAMAQRNQIIVPKEFTAPRPQIRGNVKAGKRGR